MTVKQVEHAGVLLLWRHVEGKKRATLILAHGAGAPMDSPFMEHITETLIRQGVEVVRFEFPYMAERRLTGKKRPPSAKPQLLETWRHVIRAVRETNAAPLAIGGKSMGGRMASLLADECNVAALVCLGYPFYATGKPEKPRVEHLANLQTPALIIQGERDALGNRQAVEQYGLSKHITIQWIPTANHDLKPLKASGMSHSQSITQSAIWIAQFLSSV
jgi:predicted alpha/beta-hydrolase family hydrolase